VIQSSEKSDKASGVGEFVGLVGGVGGVFGEVGFDSGDMFAEHVMPHPGLESLGEEFGADVGAFGPFPTLGFGALFGLGLEDVEAALFEVDAAGIEVAAAEGNDVGGEGAEPTEVSVGVMVVGREGVGGGGEAQAESGHYEGEHWLANENIAGALVKLRDLFPATYSRFL
jgi:hypothetical protein